ncbi:DUF309 domain-containing protein [bacterium]|nr:MAG: DUF309 domain-containing protein [bacterium]
MSIDPVLWQKALRQFNEENFFECHETLEVNWLTEKDEEQRNLLQGIIHMAAALLHRRKNNNVGYRRQLEKGLIKLNGVRLNVYDEKLRTNLSEFYKTVATDTFPHFPKINFTASEALR